MDDPAPSTIVFILLATGFLVYARYYNNLRRLSPLRGAMLLGLIEKNHLNTEKIEHYESKLLSLQLGRLVFLIPLLTSYRFLRLPFGFPLFLLFTCGIIFLGETLLPALSGFKLRDKTRFSVFETRFINFLSIMFFPVSFLFIITRETWYHLGGKKQHVYSENWLEDEIQAIIKVGEQEGIFEETEKEMLEGIIEFGDTIVREVMTPRTDIAFISSENSVLSLRQLIVKVGHSRIPVYDEKIDNIIGIVYAKDILRYDPKDFEKLDAKKIMREPFFVPETKKVRELLAEFQKKKIHLAIVVDEYGGVAGLVTIEDLIEEFIGEIRDEYDQEAEPIQELDEGVLLIDAKTYVDQLEDYYKIEMPRDDFDTVGGFIINQLGRVPATGEKITYENLQFEIIGADARCIQKIKILNMGSDESSDNSNVS